MGYKGSNRCDLILVVFPMCIVPQPYICAPNDRSLCYLKTSKHISIVKKNSIISIVCYSGKCSNTSCNIIDSDIIIIITYNHKMQIRNNINRVYSRLEVEFTCLLDEKTSWETNTLTIIISKKDISQLDDSL